MSLTRTAQKAIYGLAAIIENLLSFIDAFARPIKNEGSSLRVCLVKQDVYNDLYCCSQNADFIALIRSSLKRTGPVGLFSELHADFRIVRTIRSPECDIWQQKWFDCRQKPLSHYYDLQHNANPFGENRLEGGQSQFAVDAEAVDWSNYDLVLSLDIALPITITRRYASTVWAYWISEPCMSAYRSSHLQPVNGYDLFLNQRFWRHGFFAPLYHEINFPYAFLKSGCFSKLSHGETRSGIMIESHTKQILTERQYSALAHFGNVKFIGGTVEEIISGLSSSKYWLRLGGRPLWGNGMAEAIAGGCLAIADPSEFKNRSLFTARSRVRSFAQIVQRLHQFEADPALFISERKEQQRLLDYYCYERPLSELISKVRQIQSTRIY